ncbi:uncharacterized protein At4g04775-like [Capsella rubella]|uniref:uncharacterized protein At4g04775-like n=1 Tax=Capsella rubella TaxID=81985 RepID=UPI000CD4F6F3|nr:uncharacterized protein At4g04775-like [Capsella rubella]
MSCESGASGIICGNSSNRRRFPGIPKKCHCGSPIVDIISRSIPNPCRRYYRCEYAYDRRLVNDGHVFKWVDEALVDEVEQLDFQVGVLEEEVTLMKMERMKDMKEIKKMSVLVFCGCLLLIGLGIWYNQV